MKSNVLLSALLVTSFAHAGTLMIDLNGPKMGPCWTTSGTPWYSISTAGNGTRIQLHSVAPQLTEGVLTFNLRAFGEVLPAGSYTKVETRLIDNDTWVYRPFAAMYIITSNDWWWRLGTTYGWASGTTTNGFGPYFAYPWGDLVVPGEPPYHFPTGNVPISFERLANNGMIGTVNEQQLFNWVPGAWGSNDSFDRIALAVRLWSDVGHGATFEYLRITNNQMSVLSGTVVPPPGVAMPSSLRLVLQPLGPGSVASRTIFPDQAGSFAVPVTLSGPYNVFVDGTPELRTLVQTFTLDGTNQGAGTIMLRTGDVDDSGEVDAVDIDEVIAHFGEVVGTPGFTAAADVDRSGEVDAVDIDLVIANFGAVDD